MSRRGHGEGSIFQRGNGGWVGYVSLGPYGKPGKRKYVRGQTEAEVVAKKKDLVATLEAGLPVPDERLTVGVWLRRWLEVHQEGRSQNTVDNYTWAIERHIVPTIGGLKLRRLSPTDVADLLQQKAGEGLGRSARMRIRSVLVMAIRQAEIEGRVHRNVAALIKAPSTAPTDGRSLTVDDARSLLAQIEGERLGPAVSVMLTMGLRPGEVLGLTWSNVDLEQGIIHVRQSLTRETTGLRIGNTKTPKSRRSVATPPLTLGALRRHRRQQAEERLQAGPMWTDQDLVFASAVGTPIDPSNLRRAVSRMTKSAGLGHWSPNEMRHSAVSLMSAAGVPLEEIADVVGHDGSRMTYSVYRHVLSPVMSAGADPMQRLLGD